MVFYSDLILQSTLLSSAFWKVETFPLSSSLYSSELLNERLEYFWFKFIKKLSKEYKVYLLIKLKFDDDSYKAINSLIITTSEEFDIVKHILNKGVYKALAQYSSQQVTHLIFNYRIELDSENIINTNTLMFEKKSNLNTFTFKGPDFPLNIDHRKWGEIIYENEQDTIISIPDTKYTMIIYNHKTYREVKVLFGNRFDCSFKDEFFNENTYIRYLDSYVYIVENNKITFKSTQRKVQYIQPLKPQKPSQNYLVFDLETRLINNVMVPYCISFYDGKKAWSFYLTDFENPEEMIKEAFKSIFKRKYKGYVIYAHNFSGFDSIFIIKTLSTICNINIIVKEGKVIELTVLFNHYTFYLRDSYLILPSSLRKLAKSFRVSEKSHFPYSFVNNDSIPLDYIGIIPNYDLWVNLSEDEYKEMITDRWDLRKETIKYCEQDCLSLYQIIKKFSFLVNDNWNINLHKYPTLPSLTFGIFRINFLKEDTH